jgi:hypothetical protein
LGPLLNQGKNGFSLPGKRQRKSTVGALEIIDSLFRGNNRYKGSLLEGKESKASKGWIPSFERMTTKRRTVRFRKSKLMKFLSAEEALIIAAGSIWCYNFYMGFRSRAEDSLYNR